MAELFTGGREAALLKSLEALIGNEEKTVIRSSEVRDLLEADQLAVLYVAYKRNPKFKAIEDLLYGKMLLRQAKERARALEIISALEALSKEMDAEEHRGLKTRIAEAFKRQ